MNKPRVGYTKIGFSKAGFGCCARYAYCHMGKGSCYYDELDPEAKDYCAAYSRNRSIANQVTASENAVIEERKMNLCEEKGGQLSLF